MEKTTVAGPGRNYAAPGEEAGGSGGMRLMG